MKILSPVLALLWCSTAMLSAAPTPTALLEKSTAAWKLAGAGSFVIADGVLVAGSGNGLLWNAAKPYRNFTLKLQFNLAEPNSDSGILLRFADPGDDPAAAIASGYEIQLRGTTADKGSTGAIAAIQPPSHLPIKPTGEWNDLEITAVGPWIGVILNGEFINLFRAETGRGDSHGHIGLQSHQAGAVRFQKISISEWPDDASFTEVLADAGHPRSLLTGYHARTSDKDTPWFDKMDTGPAFYQTFADFYQGNGRADALKGVVLRPSPDPRFVVLFDTEAGKLVTATDQGIDLLNTPWAAKHGSQNTIKNKDKFLFNTASGPGWADADGKLTDNREVPGHGHYPHIAFHGHHRNGNHIVLDYQVHATPVLESVTLEHHHGIEALARSLALGPNSKELLMQVASAADGWELSADGHRAVANSGPATVIAITAASAARFAVDGVNLLVKFPAAQQTTAKLLIASAEPAAFAAALSTWPAPRPLKALAAAGPGIYPQRFETKGEVATGDAPWLVDTLTLPPNQGSNPYHAGLRFGSFDFFADGDRAALSSWEGDVWIVSGLNSADWSKLTWNRFATGLFEPLGLKIVDEVIYVSGRDQILTLHDTNNDGEADHYRSFNRDVVITDSFHEFSFSLETDSAGNFYFAKGAPVKSGGRGFSKIVAHNGVVARVSKDGSKLDVVATGLRAPGGMAVGPNGEITTGENEGTWIPACKINYLRPAEAPAFFGVEDTRHGVPGPIREPLCYLPMHVDNSGGGQVWVPKDAKFGLQAGELIHLSYGQSSLYRVLKQEVDGGQVQGGVVRIPVNLKSSAQRARFHHDGSAYVLGFRGWQTNAASDCAFHRIRFNDKPILIPNRLTIVPGGLHLGFATTLDKELAEDPQSYAIERWKYIYCNQYGSGEFSIDAPDEAAEKNAREKESKDHRQHDKVEIAAARLLDDGMTVFLEIPTIKPAMQMQIGYDLESASGEEIIGTIYNTVHQVPAK